MLFTTKEHLMSISLAVMNISESCIHVQCTHVLVQMYMYNIVCVHVQQCEFWLLHCFIQLYDIMHDALFYIGCIHFYFQ